MIVRMVLVVTMPLSQGDNVKSTVFLLYLYCVLVLVVILLCSVGIGVFLFWFGKFLIFQNRSSLEYAN